MKIDAALTLASIILNAVVQARQAGSSEIPPLSALDAERALDDAARAELVAAISEAKQ